MYEQAAKDLEFEQAAQLREMNSMIELKQHAS